MQSKKSSTMKRQSNFGHLAAITEDIDKQTALSPTYAYFNAHKIEDFKRTNAKNLDLFQKFTSALLEKYAKKDDKGKVAYPLIDGKPQFEFIDGETGKEAFQKEYWAFLARPMYLFI